jgi:hypothetical protein
VIDVVLKMRDSGKSSRAVTWVFLVCLLFWFLRGESGGNATECGNAADELGGCALARDPLFDC